MLNLRVLVGAGVAVSSLDLALASRTLRCASASFFRNPENCIFEVMKREASDDDDEGTVTYWLPLA